MIPSPAPGEGGGPARRAGWVRACAVAAALTRLAALGTLSRGAGEGLLSRYQVLRLTYACCNPLRRNPQCRFRRCARRALSVLRALVDHVAVPAGCARRPQAGAPPNRARDAPASVGPRLRVQEMRPGSRRRDRQVPPAW